MDKTTFGYDDDSVDSFKQGITYQREAFKAAKHDNNYDSMCDAIENIKAEIKEKCRAKGEELAIKRVEKICEWYRNKEMVYSTMTEEGNCIVYPADMNYKINKWLTKAYEILISQLSGLNLL